jgi:UDP-N-acetylmuramoyl-tripeptide--D-alanyl-D-alanine ligase
MPLPGQYMAENAIRAIAVGREAGLAPELVAGALSQFKPLPMRWSPVEIGDRLFINDAYNANPLSMRAAMQAFKDTAIAGDRWLVLAGMFELGESERAEHLALGEWVALHAGARLIAIGPLGAQIAQGALTAGMDAAQVWQCDGPAQAAKILRDHAAPADGILLKASRGERLEQVLTEYETLYQPS